MKRKKLYILITLLITVIIFSTAAICNQCSITPTTETKVTAAGQSDTTETASKTTQAQETTKETNASEGSQSSQQDTNQGTTQSTTTQGLSADITPTDIYPANEPNGVIFARITNNGPDTLKGSKISVTVSGSKTDISGASTQNFITQPKEYYLTLKPGETQIINLEVGIDTSKYSYNFSMTVASVDFTDPNNGNNSYSEGVASTQGSQQISKNEFPIVKGESGEIEWNAYIGSDTYCFGDNVWNNPARGFLSFDISAFSGVKIVDCSLTMSNPGIVGDPTPFGPICAYKVDWGARPLELNDFDIPGAFIASSALSNNITISSSELVKLLQSALDAGKDRFQFRLQFNYPSSDSDNSPDSYWYYFENVHFTASFIR